MTQRTSILSVLSLLCAVALALPVAAVEGNGSGQRLADAESPSDEREAGPTREEKTPTATAVYRPPRVGSARVTVAGGTRGLSKTPHIEVLAPDHVGLTTRPQPVLAWFLSATTDQRIDFTFTRRDGIEPVIEQTLLAPPSAGVQLLSLADFDVALDPGAMYEWSIAVVVDPEERDRDHFVSGAIQLEAGPPDLAADLQGSATPHRAFAHHGIWYDAIGDLSQAIVSTDSPALRLERAQLFEQVGLAEAAKFERDRVER